ncbi:hypothetical protein MHU86_15683 [Fragilaria crotonensis]|nr:hypothetical protein MHU86_15683 [Fragilaria crotonensis]
MRMPVATYRRPPKPPVVVPSQQQRMALQKQREEVLLKLSSFFGEDEDCFGGDQSPTSVFHVDKELGDDGDITSNVEEPSDADLFQQYPKQHQNDPVDCPSEDDSQFKTLQRYYSLPNAPLSASSSSSSLIATKSALKTSASSRSLNRNVSFTNLSIREYNVELGDNPSCSCGVPISLGWDYEEQEALPLDQVEDPDATAIGGSSSRRRRKTHELILSYNDRRRLLKSAGYSKEELQECLQTVQKVKHERGMTELFLAVAPLEDAMETVIHGVQNLFSQRKRGTASSRSYTANEKMDDL